jgi:hypothetical protein
MVLSYPHAMGHRQTFELSLFLWARIGTRSVTVNVQKLIPTGKTKRRGVALGCPLSALAQPFLAVNVAKVQNFRARRSKSGDTPLSGAVIKRSPSLLTLGAFDLS